MDNDTQDWVKKMAERRNQYGKECQETLKAAGLTGITPEQAELIMQPSDAPENFYCDGEISPRQAVAGWKARLVQSGLNAQQIKKAIKIALG